jgi:hypothetical protein
VNDVTLVELQRTRAKQVQFKQFSELMGKRRQVIFLAFSPLNTDLVVETITLIYPFFLRGGAPWRMTQLVAKSIFTLGVQR